MHGWRERTFLFLIVREWFLGAGVAELLYGLAGVAVYLFILYLLDLLWIWIMAAMLAKGLAVAC